MSITLAPEKRLTVEDLLAIARPRSAHIAVDEAVLRKADAEYPQKEVSLFDTEAVSTPDSTAYDAEVSRTGILCRLFSMLSLKTPVRAATVQALVNLLNHQITPFFSSYENAGKELMAFLNGKGFARVAESPKVAAAEALAAAGIGAHAVTAQEAKLFLDHPFLALGVAVVVSAGANQLLKAVDPIAALSVEAAGAKTDSFDPATFELQRQHRGQMLSASNLKVLLEGSKRVGTNKSSNAGVADLYSAPQVTGPAQETIAVASKVVDIELNSSETAPLDPAAGSVFDAAQIVLSLRNLTNALETLATASSKRVAAITGAPAEIIATSAEAVDRKAFETLFALSAALARELHTSLSTLQKIEADELAKTAAKQEKEKINDERAENKGKPQQDDSNLTPEQLAKAEAKRKAKAEKAAAKSAAKEQRKGGLVLGAGTTQLRSVALQLAGLNNESLFAENALSVFVALLSPLNLDENSLAALFAKVLEAVNLGGKRRPKIAKGARDFTPEQMRIREQAFNAIRKVFKRHGGVEIDTPVFELKEVLTGKYGEDSKLIYDLADQGGELLSLRYDLTVPFARFLAMNSVGNIKRYHIAKVYRRDNPQLARGRYREFYQCDFDVAGSYSPMVPDAEVITVATEILSDLPVGNFLVKLNHRKILDAIFEICGVPAEKFRPICSAVDKLDKMSWEDVKDEMVNEKGLDPASADKIGTFVLHSGKPMALWEQLMSEQRFGDHKGALDAMNDLKLLFGYLEAMGSLPFVSFDLSLARGLDYYTGVIYEVVLTDGTSQVGSIAAGGRYDNLVGMFSAAGVQTPCVGVSIGIERVFTIMEKKAEQLKLLQQSPIQVYIASIGANLMHQRMRIAQKLWAADIPSEYTHLDNPKFKRQLDEALERGIPFMVVFGQDEVDKGVVKVKNMKDHTEVEVVVDNVVSFLLEQGCNTVSGGSDCSFVAAMKKSELIVADS